VFVILLLCVLCTVFSVCVCVFLCIVVPLQPDTKPFAVNNDNNNK
jgi:type IV secretory pathway component VirB8